MKKAVAKLSLLKNKAGQDSEGGTKLTKVSNTEEDGNSGKQAAAAVAHSDSKIQKSSKSDALVAASQNPDPKLVTKPETSAKSNTISEVKPQLPVASKTVQSIVDSADISTKPSTDENQTPQDSKSTTNAPSKDDTSDGSNTKPSSDSAEVKMSNSDIQIVKGPVKPLNPKRIPDPHMNTHQIQPPNRLIIDFRVPSPARPLVKWPADMTRESGPKDVVAGNKQPDSQSKITVSPLLKASATNTEQTVNAIPSPSKAVSGKRKPSRGKRFRSPSPAPRPADVFKSVIPLKIASEKLAKAIPNSMKEVVHIEKEGLVVVDKCSQENAAKSHIDVSKVNNKPSPETGTKSPAKETKVQTLFERWKGEISSELPSKAIPNFKNDMIDKEKASVEVVQKRTPESATKSAGNVSKVVDKHSPQTASKSPGKDPNVQTLFERWKGSRDLEVIKEINLHMIERPTKAPVQSPIGLAASETYETETSTATTAQAAQAYTPTPLAKKPSTTLTSAEPTAIKTKADAEYDPTSSSELEYQPTPKLIKLDDDSRDTTVIYEPSAETSKDLLGYKPTPIVKSVEQPSNSTAGADGAREEGSNVEGDDEERRQMRALERAMHLKVGQPACVSNKISTSQV